MGPTRFEDATRPPLGLVMNPASFCGKVLAKVGAASCPVLCSLLLAKVGLVSSYSFPPPEINCRESPSAEPANYLGVHVPAGKVWVRPYKLPPECCICSLPAGKGTRAGTCTGLPWGCGSGLPLAHDQGLGRLPGGPL